MASTLRANKSLKDLTENVAGFTKYMARTFSEIEINGLENMQSSEKQQFMLTSTHRSHLDYLLLASELARLGVHHVRFAAGDNLTRLPVLGQRFKKMGAFSVYRGKASQRSYLFKLTEQVKNLIVNGSTVIVFPEGGRSYNGHMLDLKGGITGAAVVAQQENPDREICYLPIDISYEVPTEVPFFKHILAGRNMRDEGKNRITRLWGEFLYYAADAGSFFIRGIVSRFGFKYGKTIIDFGKPIPVNSMTDVDGNFREKSKNSFLANRASIKECVEVLQNEFLKNHRIWPHNLAAYLLLKDPSLSVDKQAEKMDELMGALTDKKTVFASENSGAELFREGLKQLKRNGVIRYKADSYSAKRQDLVAYFAAAVEDKLL